MATYSGINSGQCFSGQNIVDQSIHNYYLSSPEVYTGIDILLNASVPNAGVDAEARAYSPRCFPGTREQYIEDITNWATASIDDKSFLIYRMKGPAGVGKSAIAQTCAERVKRQGKLGATFFFSINECNDHTRFFTTVAYQLSTTLPEYKQNLNDRILNDKTVVDKNIASQFEELIIEPLQVLKELGKEVGMRTIIIDGVDECLSMDAQSQIIELIAMSVRDRTTPFRWAFFSRAEAHIEATFSLDFIIPLCRTVDLPISRQADQEIKFYLEGGFNNILRRQNISLSFPWPPIEAIQKLVDASAGLYAYSAAVLRFIESFPAADPKEALAAVLEAISQLDSRTGPLSPFAKLDNFYMLIMQRIPSHILSSVQLLFATLLEPGYSPAVPFHVATTFNRLQLSEAVFHSMRKHLHAVLYFQDETPALQFPADIDIRQPYYEQRAPNLQRALIYSSLGRFMSYHKSFYDFLADPARSADFCVTTPKVQLKLFESHLQTHFHFEQIYSVRGSEPELASGVPNSVAVLSFPLSNEYGSSYLRDVVFRDCTARITLSSPADLLTRLSHHSLQRLSEVDYRKYFLVDVRQFSGYWNLRSLWGIPGEIQCNAKSQFRRLNPYSTQYFNCITFLSMIKLFKKHGIIKSYHPTFSSRLKHLFQAKVSGSEHSGLYILGRGDKAIIWYWELNINSKEYYEFRTLDLMRAMEIYEASKYEMWSRDWRPPPP